MMHQLLPAARLATMAVMALCAAVIAAGSPHNWRELIEGCGGHAHCTLLLLTPREVEALHSLGLSLPIYASIHVGYELLACGALLLLGAAIVWRGGDAWFGLLVAVAMATFALILSEADAALGRAYPDLIPLMRLLESAGILSFGLLVLLFPNGKFVPSWAWLLGLPLLLATIVALALMLPAQAETYYNWHWLIFAGTLIAGMVSQAYRFRSVSTIQERQQTKWVVLGLSAVVLALLGWTGFMEFPWLPEGMPQLMFNLAGMAVLVVLLTSFPVTLGLSILRYRLWDIDLIIRQTMVYGALTACLGLGYFGSVITLQSLLQTFSWAAQSQVIIVLSTLLQAAMFDPLRRRLQDLIDRRFYRQRYDAARVLTAFGSRMRAEVDMGALRDGLVSVVNDTLQPEWSSVWLREPGAGAKPARDSQSKESRRRMSAANG